MSNRYLKSPLNYIGGKHRLLPQIIPKFSPNIGTFVDMFCGGCNVGINVSSNKVICNDIDTNLIKIYKYFHNNDIGVTLCEIDRLIKEFCLDTKNEDGFLNFRNHYNSNKNPIDLYVLSCFAFNYKIRFNENGDYNNSFGRNKCRFSSVMRNNLVKFLYKIHSKEFVFSNYSFHDFSLDKLSSEDFIYCDPPYMITNALYNDGWTTEDEEKLYLFLDEVNNKNIKFALSNVTHHKGKVNNILLDWSKKYNITELNFSYSNCCCNTNKGASREVLVTNYMPENNYFDVYNFC